MEKLSQFCRDFLKRDVKIKILEPIKNGGTDTNVPVEKKTDQNPIKNKELPKQVQDIIQVFKGEIKAEIPIDKKKDQ